MGSRASEEKPNALSESAGIGLGRFDPAARRGGLPWLPSGAVGDSGEDDRALCNTGEHSQPFDRITEIASLPFDRFKASGKARRPAGNSTQMSFYSLMFWCLHFDTSMMPPFPPSRPSRFGASCQPRPGLELGTIQLAYKIDHA